MIIHTFFLNEPADTNVNVKQPLYNEQLISIFACVT